MEWLDAETKALLHQPPKDKLAPPTMPDYALVLLRKSSDAARLVRAVCRIKECTVAEATRLLAADPPTLVHGDLSYHDALLGQFEFVSCNAPSVILRSEVVDAADAGYLRELYARLEQSPEFQPVQVTIRRMPDGDAARRFVDQFLCVNDEDDLSLDYPFSINVPRKKARIMTHWAARIGVELETAR